MTVPASPASASGVVYHVHLTQPYRHARHHTGWTADLEGRLAEHRTGRGTRLLQAITQAGIEWTLAKTRQGTRERERQLQTPRRGLPAMPSLPRQPRPHAMTEYRVITTDDAQPALTEHNGPSYHSLPQPREHALAPARALVGTAQLPDEHAPWRQARPGGTCTVRIEPAP